MLGAMAFAMSAEKPIFDEVLNNLAIIEFKDDFEHKIRCSGIYKAGEDFFRVETSNGELNKVVLERVVTFMFDFERLNEKWERLAERLSPDVKRKIICTIEAYKNDGKGEVLFVSKPIAKLYTYARWFRAECESKYPGEWENTDNKIRMEYENDSAKHTIKRRP